MARRFTWLLIAACFPACLVGCAPNANGVMRPTLPWTRNVPNLSQVPQRTFPQTAQNPWALPTDQLSGVLSRPALPKASPELSQRRWSFLNDMMKRADQQELLAESQRRELEQLKLLQEDQYDKERAYVIQQRERERQLLLKQYEEKERLLASREKKYRGQYNQMRGRASDLDTNNRDLHAQLAKSERERQMLKDELALVKGRLDDTTSQLTRTRNVGRETVSRLKESDQRLRAMQASASKRRGSAAIRANSSVGRSITAISVPGMNIRQDGDLVRIAIPTDEMFMTGTAMLHQGSQAYVEQIANILQQHYPQQMVGIEAHTDHGGTAIGSTQWRSHHQLTAAQSMAVFEQLTERRISPHRLFVLGHGGNHPLVSDGTPQGQAMNRRVEIVVYPETYGR